jgi:hypothetical protein
MRDQPSALSREQARPTVDGIIAHDFTDTLDDAFISNLLNVLRMGDVEPDLRIILVVRPRANSVADADVLNKTSGFSETSSTIRAHYEVHTMFAWLVARRPSLAAYQK